MTSEFNFALWLHLVTQYDDTKMADFIGQSATFRALGWNLAPPVSTGLARIGGRMAELLMKSATVELATYAPRELPHYRTPEQIR